LLKSRGFFPALEDGKVVIWLARLIINLLTDAVKKALNPLLKCVNSLAFPGDWGRDGVSIIEA